MSLNNDIATAAILIKLELPEKTVRVSDGGVVVFIEEDNQPYIYTSEDEEYGTLVSGDAVTEGQGDEIPATSLTFLPNSNEGTEALTSPDMQWSPVSIWIVSLDEATGDVLEAEDYFFGVVDVPTFKEDQNGRSVDFLMVALSEMFFQQNDGNRLSPENHKRIYPNERGLDNMTGIEIDVPWMTESRPRSQGSSSGGGGGTYTPSPYDAVYNWLNR